MSCVVEIGKQDEKGREITSLVLETSSELVRIEISKSTNDKKAERAEEKREAILTVLKRDFPKGARYSEWEKRACEVLKIGTTTFENHFKKIKNSGEVRYVMSKYISFTPLTPTTPELGLNGVETVTLEEDTPLTPITPILNKNGVMGESQPLFTPLTPTTPLSRREQSGVWGNGVNAHGVNEANSLEQELHSILSNAKGIENFEEVLEI